jgi:hypothetical protein
MAQPQRRADRGAKREWLAAKQSEHQPRAVDKEALPRRLAHEVASLGPLSRATRRPVAHRTDD